MIPEISEGEIDTCILTAQMGAKMNKKKIPGKEILRGILLLLLCLVVCFPFFMMISTSLKSYTEIKSPVFHLLPEKIRLENYVESVSYTHLDGKIEGPDLAERFRESRERGLSLIHI